MKGKVFHGVEVVDTFNYKHITKGKKYKVCRTDEKGITIIADNGFRIYYPNKCFF